MCLTYIAELFLISTISSMGLAIIFVEKRYDFPVQGINLLFRKIVGKIHPKLSVLGECTVCFTFWSSLLVEIYLLFYSNYTYFLWPVSGFAASGSMWVLITYLNLIDREGDDSDDDDEE
jgi:hypothetical protein